MTDTTAVTREFNGLTIPAAGTYELDQAHQAVGFAVRHLMVSKVRGQFTEATATITVAEDPLQSSVTATIQTGSLSSGQPGRDAHVTAADFLDVEKYPTIEYRSSGVKSNDGNKFVLVGDLTIKGVTKQVELDVVFEGVARSPFGHDVFGFAASTEIDRDDFELAWDFPLETGGLVLGKKIKIEIDGEAIRQ